jgi:hypothetical protein
MSARFKDRDDPFLVLHPMIGKALAGNDRVRKMGKVSSPNERLNMVYYDPIN